MRVTIVSRIYRPEPSAASLYLGAVADELLAGGAEVEIITAAPPRGMATTSNGERVRTFPVLRDKRGYVRGYLQYMSFDIPLAFRLLTARRPDVLFMEPPPTTGVVVRVVCALRRIRYVYDAADIWSDASQLEPVSPFVIRVVRAMESFALRGAAHVVTISSGVVERARALGVNTPITVTGFGAETTEFPFVEPTPQKLFIYAGSYASYHGADILIDAFSLFLGTHPGYILRFIGNGPERPLLEARAKALGITTSVEYLDPVQPSELCTHLGSAVATLATLKPKTIYSYAYASKVFSSMSAGCPVIFAGPGPTAALLDTANAHARAGEVSAYDPDSIAEAMRRFAEAPSSRDERFELSDYIRRTHSMSAVARRVVDVLLDVAKRG